jgi:hypothetical protein
VLATFAADGRSTSGSSFGCEGDGVLFVCGDRCRSHRWATETGSVLILRRRNGDRERALVDGHLRRGLHIRGLQGACRRRGKAGLRRLLRSIVGWAAGCRFTPIAAAERRRRGWPLQRQSSEAGPGHGLLVLPASVLPADARSGLVQLVPRSDAVDRGVPTATARVCTVSVRRDAPALLGCARRVPARLVRARQR